MFELYAIQLPKTHGAECPTYGLLNWNRATFNGTGNICERRRREPLGGLGACYPRKFSNLKALKRHFQHSQADSCIKNVPKIDRYFLFNFERKERCNQLYYIFVISNYSHTPLMLAILVFFYQRPKRAQCTFIFCSFTLRELTIISLGKRLVISVSHAQCLI